MKFESNDPLHHDTDTLPQSYSIILIIVRYSLAISVQTGVLLAVCFSLEKAVLQEPTNSEVHFMLGRTLWELRANQDVKRLTERCFTAFLKVT